MKIKLLLGIFITLLSTQHGNARNSIYQVVLSARPIAVVTI